jgi:hypothetical protein
VRRDAAAAPELTNMPSSQTSYLATGASTGGQFGLYRWDFGPRRAPASMLLLFTPGAPREDYFETLVEVARGAVMTAEERAEFMIAHDTYWRLAAPGPRPRVFPRKLARWASHDSLRPAV